MDIAYIVTISSVLILLIFSALSFFQSQNLRFQLWFILIAGINIGILTSLILINYTSKSALIWPGLLLVFIINKVLEIRKYL
ncbi:MAG: hypothetical protein ACOVO9_15255 [Bacteroidia bacterium]|jgi:hypothetical protein